ncbi:MAG TPA: ankyrin repeat domain-containing protein [Rhizomicrobium sp.]|nr:ankyrin repeat domain-containing protein [Rhizomicrobium sp.]
MSNDPNREPLPDRPHLRHLKHQAKDLLKAGATQSLSGALLQVARKYGFASWVKLKTYVESLGEVGQLKQAIDTNDIVRVKALMTRNPTLHKAPLGYNKNGPLTWVAECRIPWEPPTVTRLAIATWMIENGSDVHQGGDGPLMRAALNEYRIPMMELLVSHGANVNALWAGHFPIIFAPCESLDPVALRWLLDKGANPNVSDHGYEISGHSCSGTALDYLIESYERSPQRLSSCIDVLLEAGGITKYNDPGVLYLLRSKLDHLAALIDADHELVNKRFPQFECGKTGGRSLTVKGGTLLHVASEYINYEAASLLLDRGADVNARALIHESGVGGQTPIFHAVTQLDDRGLNVAKMLVARGADLNVQAKLPGRYEYQGEIVECTPLGYALLLDDVSSPSDKARTIEFLRNMGAPE